jgi:lysophospholipase L1-like esterase
MPSRNLLSSVRSSSSSRSSSRSRLFVGAIALCFAAASACSGSSSPGDTATGGAAPGSGGLTATGGGPAGSPSLGTGGSPGSSGTGGSVATVVTGGTGGASPSGTGGSDTTAGSGGTVAQTGTGGSTATATGGSPSNGGASGPASSGGATGNAGAGGTGNKPPVDTSNLPAITIHLAGDSTVMTYAATTTQEGWGQELGQFFNSKVTINNQGQGGANIQSFYGGRWKTLINAVKAGDYVFAMFGINDSGTTHGPVAVPAFTTQMGVMADEVAAKKATFIPTTSSPLQVWVGGKETNTRLQPYVDATIALGMTKNLLVDDLNARGVEYYNMVGQTAAAALTFNGDKAHFDKAGATEMASLAAKELVRINSPLAAYLK